MAPRFRRVDHRGATVQNTSSDFTKDSRYARSTFHSERWAAIARSLRVDSCSVSVTLIGGGHCAPIGYVLPSTTCDSSGSDGVGPGGHGQYSPPCTSYVTSRG